MTSGRVVGVARSGGVVVGKGRCDDVVDADSNNADNSDVVDGLTDGIVEEEFSIVVEGGFSVVIIVEVE